MALKRRFGHPDGAKLALERRFGRHGSAKLALERRFGRPSKAKLALERRCGRPDGVQLALERRGRRPDGALVALERRFRRPDRKKTFRVLRRSEGPEENLWIEIGFRFCYRFRSVFFRFFLKISNFNWPGLGGTARTDGTARTGPSPGQLKFEIFKKNF